MRMNGEYLHVHHVHVGLFIVHDAYMCTILAHIVFSDPPQVQCTCIHVPCVLVPSISFDRE